MHSNKQGSTVSVSHSDALEGGGVSDTLNILSEGKQ